MRRVLAILTSIALLPCAVMADGGTAGLGSQIWSFGEATAGAPAPARTDKVLLFGKDADGKLILSGLAMVPEDTSVMTLPDNALAVLRTRTKNAEGNKRPDANDLRFARGKRIPVYIMGEWSKPPVLWEIDPTAKPLRFRTIARDGSAGAWQALSN